LLELRDVDLSYNALTGKLPTFGVRFINFLKCLKLHDNHIKGSFHVLWGNLTELTTLALHNNKIGGPIPEAMTNLKKLEEFTMHNNRLNGALPESFGKIMPGLRTLILSRNRLTGPIPVEALASCHGLVTLNIDGNHFEFDGDFGSKDQVIDYIKGRLHKTAMVCI